MKRISGIMLILLLVAPFCFAQVPNSPHGGAFQTDVGCNASSYTSNFTNIGTTGLATDGNPGFLVLTGTDKGQGDEKVTYYLWVDHDGDLLIASHTTMKFLNGFPDGNWKDITDGVTGVTTVGEQT